jgi:hydroxyacylglutathione hydrolase
VWNEEKIGYLFDCGGTNIDRLETYIKTNSIQLKYIILTHGHGDHISGLKLLVNKYPKAEVYIGKEEQEFFTNPEYNLAYYIDGHVFTYEGEYRIMKEGDIIGEFKVIDSPGHTIGSKCFYAEKDKMLISGDTMFKNSFGRYDMPTSSGESLFKSLKKLCDTLPDDTVVYSGHTEDTTIGEERKFLKAIGLF